MNEIFGICLSNLSFLIGLLGAMHKDTLVLRFLSAIDYVLLALWTYLYVEKEQMISVFIWCLLYVVAYLYHFFRELKERKHKAQVIAEEMAKVDKHSLLQLPHAQIYNMQRIDAPNVIIAREV